jgi:competence protein ComFC
MFKGEDIMFRARDSELYGLKNWFSSLKDLGHLVYPSACLSCGKELSRSESDCCYFCLDELTFTFFENYTEPTQLDQLFWGRIKVQSSFALMYFEKDKTSQKILHELKYGHNPRIGMMMGRLIAEKIKKTGILNGAEALLPVPIHPRKRFARGYNQSEMIAKGIAELIDLPLEKSIVRKVRHTGSQTRRGRFLRWDNVSENFTTKGCQVPQHSHYVIVDDVITTGATIEAMVNVLKENYPELRFTVISLAIAK